MGGAAGAQRTRAQVCVLGGVCRPPPIPRSALPVLHSLLPFCLIAAYPLVIHRTISGAWFGAGGLLLTTVDEAWLAVVAGVASKAGLAVSPHAPARRQLSDNLTLSSGVSAGRSSGRAEEAGVEGPAGPVVPWAVPGVPRSQAVPLASLAAHPLSRAAQMPSLAATCGARAALGSTLTQASQAPEHWKIHDWLASLWRAGEIPCPAVFRLHGVSWARVRPTLARPPFRSADAADGVLQGPGLHPRAPMGAGQPRVAPRPAPAAPLGPSHRGCRLGTPHGCGRRCHGIR